MKILTASLLVLSLCFIVPAGAIEKHADVADQTISAPGRLVLTGDLGPDISPIWDRSYGYSTPTPETCDYPLQPASQNGQALAVFCIVANDSEPIEVVVSPEGTTISDTTLHIFCFGFQIYTPLDNGVFFDDDDGEGLLSAITAADGVVLTPDEHYYLVISTYGSDVAGSYVINTSDNVELCEQVGTSSMDWSSLKALFD